MSHRAYTPLLGALLAASLAAGYGCETPSSAPPSSVKPRDAGVSAAATGNAPAAPAKDPGAGTRVIVDVSGSMRGFVVKDPKSGGYARTLETVHRVIDQTLSTMGLSSPLERCLLGDELQCSGGAPYSIYSDPKTYGKSTSRLDLALLRPQKAADANPAAPAPVDTLDPHRLTVLVTDGVEATDGSAAAAGAESTIATSCLNGADPACVGALLSARVHEGYGLWLVAVMLPFQGRHYAERGLDSSHQKRIDDHLAELRKVPEWYGMEVSAKTLQREKSGNSFYEYVGAKPLLFFVLTRDHAAGREFVAQLIKRLEGEHVGRPERLALRSVELAPLGRGEYRFGRVVRTDKTPAADRVIFGTPHPDGAALIQPVRCDAGGRTAFMIPLQPSAATPALPPFILENVSLRAGAHSLDRRILEPPQESPGGFASTLNCELLQSGKFAQEFELVATTRIAETYPAGSWWVDFSSDNTYERPERAFGLSDLVHIVQKSVFDSERVAARLTLEIERQ
jgi:hypothetical protein